MFETSTEKTYKIGDILWNTFEKAVIIQLKGSTGAIVLVDPINHRAWAEQYFYVKDLGRITRDELNEFGFADWDTK